MSTTSPSPLEFLAAFAITFLLGATTAMCLNAYTEHLRKAVIP